MQVVRVRAVVPFDGVSPLDAYNFCSLIFFLLTRVLIHYQLGLQFLLVDNSIIDDCYDFVGMSSLDL